VSAETPEEADGLLSGFKNLGEGVWSEVRKQFVYFLNGGMFEILALACENGQTSNLDMRNLKDDLTIERSITIPQGMTVNATGTNIVIPDGVTLTVNGGVDAAGLIIREGGALILNGHHLNLRKGDAKNFVIDGSLTLYTKLDLQSHYWLSGMTDEEKANVSYEGRGGFNIVFLDVETETALTQAGEIASPTVYPIVHVNDNFTLTEDMTVPEGVALRANKGFTVPDGKKLTLNGEMQLNDDGVLTVYGTLENKHSIKLLPWKDGRTALRLIFDGGLYTGFGDMGVADPVPGNMIRGLDLESFKQAKVPEGGTRFWREETGIDLMLPAMLTEIESEAFAGGAFRSVCIPAAVTTIASDAFGDTKGLTIFGSTDTAREFAASHGYPFVEYTPAA